MPTSQSRPPRWTSIDHIFSSDGLSCGVAWYGFGGGGGGGGVESDMMSPWLCRPKARPGHLMLAQTRAPRADFPPSAHDRRDRLLDETDRERIAVVHAVLRLQEGDDREDDADDPERPHEEDADEDEREDPPDHVAHQDRDLEVQRLLALGVREGAAVLEDQPDDERR